MQTIFIFAFGSLYSLLIHIFNHTISKFWWVLKLCGVSLDMCTEKQRYNWLVRGYFCGFCLSHGISLLPYQRLRWRKQAVVSEGDSLQFGIRNQRTQWTLYSESRIVSFQGVSFTVSFYRVSFIHAFLCQLIHCSFRTY